MKKWSDKTANFLSSCGIGRGDYVMVILRRHYQFWFVATALAKLGAVMVPATFMLKEHDLTYRINGADIKAVIVTSAQDIADVVDNVADECPSLKTRILVNPAGAGSHAARRGGQPPHARRRACGPRSLRAGGDLRGGHRARGMGRFQH